MHRLFINRLGCSPADGSCQGKPSYAFARQSLKSSKCRYFLLRMPQVKHRTSSQYTTKTTPNQRNTRHLRESKLAESVVELRKPQHSRATTTTAAATIVLDGKRV